MRFNVTIASTLALAASAAGAQVVVAPRAPAARALSIAGFDNPRSVIGISTSASTGSRDTLGLLVSSVTRNGPAEKAGIEEGNRIAMINGVSLKLAPADLGDPDTERLMTRRLTRELDKVKPGDEVTLSVYGNGQTRSIKVKTIDPDSLYETTRNVYRKMDDRATLGISLASTGSKRDTLGVFVIAVDEDGPAAKAGLEEGARIASINGVDLRVSRDDAGDDFVSSTRLNRLEREMNKVKPGEAVELKINQNGSMRTIKVTTASMADLRNASRSTRMMGTGNGVTIIRNGDALAMELDAARIGETVRRATEAAAQAAGSRIEDMGRVMDEFGRSLGKTSGTIRWMSNEDPKPVTPARTRIVM